MGMSVVSVMATLNHQTLIPQRPNYYTTNSTTCLHNTTLIRYPCNHHNPVLFSPLCSSSPTSLVQQEEETPLPSPTSTEDPVPLPPGGCKACGRQEIEKGCNGEGRIQGGIATVPGFGWWPIKAYRPCPAFVASGGRYRRQGQSMDEVAFGRSDKESSLLSGTDVQSK